ncbi:hypothetical protein TBLA_0E01510 [Henningerozyma blattae CBS 6284]|uniref:Major facilitator superfamily (MFS) profile domain-containing protein n=1 Tax=Henningerozyma blattae (strain ATCC 34711 / CBS 6284 / DSM 70876 / NBRC 10599 / NRRL Y-10934 / UCD 77-7) TaxID=1071380 RepID=I2H4A6_HENB6|nr:hypothetical protein TBLA_0E01510 [Tetrapisispora blattae CBS 6284]CCH61208.1 hypothetical protein TBLA_0E01510 [Tetrapisispora blattae CBS 6284]
MTPPHSSTIPEEDENDENIPNKELQDDSSSTDSGNESTLSDHHFTQNTNGDLSTPEKFHKTRSNGSSNSSSRDDNDTIEENADLGDAPIDRRLSTSNSIPDSSLSASHSIASVPVPFTPGAGDLESFQTPFYRTSTLNSGAESSTHVNKRLSRIFTGSINANPDFNSPDEDLDLLDNDAKQKEEIDYSDIPLMGGGRPYPPLIEGLEAYEVTFDGPDDPMHPFNWPLWKRSVLSLLLCLDCLNVSVGSSIFSSGMPQLEEKYHIIEVVAILGVTLYVLGFAFSPVIYAPLSELYGRRGVIVISAFGFSLFQFAVATAENIQTIMICRFFAGFLGAAPFPVVPAAFADMFDTNLRGKAICLFSMGVFLGPVIAPVMGSYMAKYTTWRWLNYLVACTGAFLFVLLFLFFDETNHPTILVNKAKEIRKKTNNKMIRAAHEDVELSIKLIIRDTVSRPIVMLFTEPILLFITIYNSFVYGILYLMLEAYPIVFVEGYGYKTNGILPYCSLIVGMVLCSTFIWYMEKDYLRRVERKGKLVPEARLYPMIPSGVLFSAGILWFCWTGAWQRRIHWVVPTIAGSLIGFGLIGIFLPCLNYIIESYLLLTASAVAANTFMRSAFAGVFPLFAGYMFHRMHIEWAGMLLGLLAAGMIPVPLIFLKYGPGLRRRSKWAYSE